MWHITSAEVFSEDNVNQPVATVLRSGGGMYVVEVQPGRTLPPSSIQPHEDGSFDTFEDALAYASGQ